MPDPYLQQLCADRIGGANYGKDDASDKFEKIKRAKQAALQANPQGEMIDMGEWEEPWVGEARSYYEAPPP